MKRSFGARRAPRRIGQDDDSGASEQTVNSAEEGTQSPEPVVRRPGTLSNPKKTSSLRLSFGPGEAGNQTTGDDVGATFTPKKSNLSRIALERHAERKARASLSADRLPFRADPADGKPRYDKEYLDELKSSTPSTPKDLRSRSTSDRDDDDDDADGEKRLDIASKFGPPSATNSLNASIPTAAEIREKKERRARLAKEQEADEILLDDADDPFVATSDDDGNCKRDEVSLRPQQPKYAETRLVPDDEDVAEGFDTFVSDGTLSLGKQAEREAARRRRAEIRSMIALAEGGASDASEEEEDSDADRTAAYEAAQTRAGTYSSRPREGGEAGRSRTPPRIRPLPELGAVLERLKAMVGGMEAELGEKVGRMEGLRREKKELDERARWIQSQLKEAGERFEKLSADAGLAIEGGIKGSALPQLLEGDRMVVGRGLESLGATPIRASPTAVDGTVLEDG